MLVSTSVEVRPYSVQPLLDRCAFRDPIARGLATAGSAHGLGTAALARKCGCKIASIKPQSSSFLRHMLWRCTCPACMGRNCLLQYAMCPARNTGKGEGLGLQNTSRTMLESVHELVRQKTCNLINS